MELTKATLRLFKSLPISNKKKKFNELVNRQTIPMGFVFAPEVIANFEGYDLLIDMVQELYGLSAEKLNQSFHKSWAKIKDTPME